jgi:hypothetical protein
MRVFMRPAVIVLLIAVVGGIGYGVWDAGYERGLIEAADSTAEIVVTQPYRGGFFRSEQSSGSSSCSCSSE